MRSARRCAPTPRPGKFLGQVVTMRQVMLPCAMAGAASPAVAAAAPTAPAPAVLKNSRLFTKSSQRVRVVLVTDWGPRRGPPVRVAPQKTSNSVARPLISSSTTQQRYRAAGRRREKNLQRRNNRERPVLSIIRPALDRTDQQTNRGDVMNLRSILLGAAALVTLSPSPRWPRTMPAAPSRPRRSAARKC